MFPPDSRILIVDDSDKVRALVRTQLNILGFKNLFEAVNGGEALGFVRAGKKDGKLMNLILLDWNMPVMNGVNFLVELKADIGLRGIPVLIITAESDVKQVVQAISAWASEYILKPFDEKMILDKMKSIWMRSMSQRA